MQGGVVEVEVNALAERGVAEADTVDDQCEVANGVELPSCHSYGDIEVVTAGGACDRDASAVGGGEEAGAGGDGHTAEGEANVAVSE